MEIMKIKILTLSLVKEACEALTVNFGRSGAYHGQGFNLNVRETIYQQSLSTTFGILPCSFTISSHSKTHCISDEFLKDQEKFMISMALKESMKVSGSESETPVTRSEKKVTETSSSKACEDPTGQHSAGNLTTGLDV